MLAAVIVKQQTVASAAPELGQGRVWAPTSQKHLFWPFTFLSRIVDALNASNCGNFCFCTIVRNETGKNEFAFVTEYCSTRSWESHGAFDTSL